MWYAVNWIAYKRNWCSKMGFIVKYTKGRPWIFTQNRLVIPVLRSFDTHLQMFLVDLVISKSIVWQNLLFFHVSILSDIYFYLSQLPKVVFGIHSPRLNIHWTSIKNTLIYLYICLESVVDNVSDFLMWKIWYLFPQPYKTLFTRN